MRGRGDPAFLVRFGAPALPLRFPIALAALLAASLTQAGAPALAQATPDPRQRVEIRYERPDTKGGAQFARVRESQCRESVADPATDKALRRRIVTLAAREWEAFHFPTLDIASAGLPLAPRIHSRGASAKGRAIVPDAINPPLATPAQRALRLGLVEDDADAIERIGGYWSVVPGQSAVATQNVIWGRGGWPGAGWAQPWSAAFLSWVMCEAGLTRPQFARAPTHWAYLTPMFDAPAASAFTPAPLSTPVAPGDLVCAGRAESKEIATLDEARRAAAQGAPMHCDVVAGLLPDRALLIGGNVMNAVMLTVAPADRRGRILHNPHRAWFGVMKLKAPDDANAALYRAEWSCLGKSADVIACLQAR
ncbi:MAG: hypothetical protein BGP06_08610 [Rhizobiales bacterium 65-9]|nr:MAG: hypothetical protein BGP06_08610 [Rhizobiales bacterium 65-9]